MGAADPLGAYLAELGRELRGPRRARRRILDEVRAHLLDAAEAEASWPADPRLAAESAIVRFGPAAETARQFDRSCRRRQIRRAAAPLIAALAITSTATATVWASGPGSGSSHSRRAPAHVETPRHMPARGSHLAVARGRTHGH
jgi:hypothetical protein